MKKRTSYVGLGIFIVGLIMFSFGIYAYSNAKQNDVSLWSWFSFIGFILFCIGGIITLFWIKNKLKLKIKTKFYIGLLLIIIGIVTNSIFYYYYAQGLIVTGFIGIFTAVSNSPLFLILYFAVGSWLVYKNRPRYWIDQK